MVDAIDIPAILAKLPVLHAREDSSEAEAENAFANLGMFGGATLFVGSFSGTSPWERHPKGDEMVQILAGDTDLTLLLAAGEKTLSLKPNMLVIVPQNIWHRFNTAQFVTLLTATPQPTDISLKDPRQEN